jgi:hypothetical protein
MLHSQVIAKTPFKGLDVRPVVRQPAAIENILDARTQLLAVADIGTTDVQLTIEVRPMTCHGESQ